MFERLLQKNQSGGEDSKVGFHGTPLVIAWLPLINFAVLIAAMRWHKYSFYAHLFLSLIVIGLTLAGTLHILIDSWINIEADQTIQKVHNIAGLVVTIWLGLQFISGILARVIQYSAKIGTNACIWIKRFHYISSYLIMIVSKFDYLNIKFKGGKFDGSFVVLLILDIIFLALYLLIKFRYWTLSQQIIDNQLVNKSRDTEPTKLREIVQSAKQSAINLKQQFGQSSFRLPNRISLTKFYQSQNQIQLENYVIFNDFVYDTDPFKQLHPGGQYVIKLMNKREIDRFMYGNYAAQLTPNVKVYNHSQDSMRLCGFPVAKINRISPIKGLKTFLEMKMIKCQKLSVQGQTYVVHLKPQNGMQLKFQGFQHEKQIGQYFSLTISNQKGRNRCTRLYTTIWSIRPQNIEFMAKNFPESTVFLSKKSNIQVEMNQNYFQSSTNLLIEEVVPFVIKKYIKGEFTPRMLTQEFKGQIIISEPMGAGMKYDQISETGKVLLICGGTGILPFCDFIDLIFKRTKYLQKFNLSSLLIQNDPLISTDLVKNREFIFLCAVQNALDLPPLSVYQLNYLSGSAKIKFSTRMRVKSEQSVIANQHKNITLQKEYFNQNVKRQLKLGNICQIYICGSPQMNASIGKIMVQNQIDPNLYHFM